MFPPEFAQAFLEIRTVSVVPQVPASLAELEERIRAFDDAAARERERAIAVSQSGEKYVYPPYLEDESALLSMVKRALGFGFPIEQLQGQSLETLCDTIDVIGKMLELQSKMQHITAEARERVLDWCVEAIMPPKPPSA